MVDCRPLAFRPLRFLLIICFITGASSSVIVSVSADGDIAPDSKALFEREEVTSRSNDEEAAQGETSSGEDVDADELHKAQGPVNVEIASARSLVATESALILIGQLAFVMSSLYLLNSTDPDVRKASWKTLSCTLGIFVSMLAFMATKSAWIMVFKHHHDSDSIGLAASFLRFFAAWLGGPYIMLRAAGRDQSLSAVGTTVGYFTAFAGADAFGSFLEIEPWSKTPGACIGGVVVSFLMLSFLSFLASWARHFVTKAAEPSSEDGAMKQKWSVEHERQETIYIGFILGLLLSMWIRFCIDAPIPGPYGRPKGHSKISARKLICVSTAVLILGAALLPFLHRFTGPDRSWGVQRLANLIMQTFAMLSGWLILFSSEWQYWYITDNRGFGNAEAADLSAAMVLALFLSVIVFLFIYGIDFVADRLGPSGEAIRSLNIACVVVIGVSWQRVFYTAIKYAGAEFQNAERLVDILLILSVIIIVTPAWYHFIVPASLEGYDGLAQPKDLPSGTDSALGTGAAAVRDSSADRTSRSGVTRSRAPLRSNAAAKARASATSAETGGDDDEY
eukprot:TRINITY_DN2367_c0_g1_i10.p1 TRINITY_DN2367_c0_g1~~TRINITY_DN2367_c0_g1_i10.p1  ORF type:complete len:564 (-),score=80.22 TRINITY_DN2367_c0_g1_i10:194-1885(-)